MTIEFPCPHCQQLVRTPDAAAGKRGKCPSCSTIVNIPGAKSPPAAAGTKPATNPKPASASPVKPVDPGPIEFSCASCGQTVRTPRAAAGKKGKCPHCTAIVQIPAAAITAAPAARPALHKPVAKPVQKAATGTPPARSSYAPLDNHAPLDINAPLPELESRKQTTKAAVEDGELELSPQDKPILPPKPAAKPAIKSTSRATVQAMKPAAAPDPFNSVYENAAPGLPDLPPLAASKPATGSKPATPTKPIVAAPARPSAQPKPAEQPAIIECEIDPLPGVAPLPSAGILEAKPALQPLDSGLTPLGAFEPLSPISNLDPVLANASLTALQPLPVGAAPSTGVSKGSVNIPAIIQLVVVIPFLLLYLLYLLLCLISLCVVLLATAATSFRMGAGPLLSNLAYTLVTLGLIAAQFIILVGSARQLERRSHTLALIAAWLAVIPCVSPMGMPAGIWSLVMLYRDEVKRSFR